MPRPVWKFTASLLIAGLLLPVIGLPSTGVLAGMDRAPLQQAYSEPFLYPPFPGTASEEAVFDHSNPNYSQTDARTVAFTGDQADKLCPALPSVGAPPQAGVCDGGAGIYWSTSLGDWISYNGHDGIDFGMQYRPVLAAAEADQVLSAGWQDPMDHRYSYGLSIKLHHSNGYATLYGHLSSINLQYCASPGCVDLRQGEQIGYSGSTGNSAGPHLHFGVISPAFKSVDPYGWTGEYSDPWPYNQVNSLWVQLPSVVPYYGSSLTVLPSGDPLPLPTAPANSLVVDDSSAGFTSLPAACWTTAATAAGQSENGSLRYIQPIINGAATCTARWTLPAGRAAGMYAVYVRIPAVHATSEGALYSISHAGQTQLVTVNQAVFPNPYYVPDGWLFIGRYRFNGTGNEYVSLANLTQDTASSYTTRELAADAVRFSPIPASLPASTPTATPSSTRTATITRTASFTPSSRWTATPSDTPSQTASSTPTVTATKTETPAPTATRLPPKTSLTPRRCARAPHASNSP